MKRILIALCCCCWLALAIGVQAQTPATETQQQAALNRNLMMEVKSLRRELLQQAIEFQQWKLQQISRELQQVQAEQQRLANEEQMMQLETAEISAASDSQSELEMHKGELAGERSQRLRRRQLPVNERLSELMGQSLKEEKRLQQLTEQLKTETASAR